MNKLARIIFSIFLSNRYINSNKVENITHNDNQDDISTPEVELPPPQQPDIDLTGEYDPLRETSVIFNPLSEDVKFFNLYCTETQHDFLLEKSDFSIQDVTETIAIISGAANELKIIFDYLGTDPSHYRLRLYKVQGCIILGANLLDNHSNDWYYCTLLELPEGRFNPIILTVKKSPKNARTQNLEHWADHSRPRNGGK